MSEETNDNAKKERCRHGRRRWKIPFFIVISLLIKSAFVFALWNQLVPDLFHGPEVTYVQAIGLMILAKLFVGFGGHFPGRHHYGHRGWKKQWLEHLTPEERAKFREKLRKHCE